MDRLELRVLVLLVVVALMFTRLIGVVGIVPGAEWLTAIFCFGLACLTAAVVLLLAVVAPAEYIGRWDSERARLFFYAVALIAVQMVVTAFLTAYSVVYASS